MQVGIAGVGGIGSNVAFQLVRAGVQDLKIVDFDYIEPTNLNRQFYFADQVGQPKAMMLAENLKRINPDIKVEALQLRLDTSNMAATFANAAVVVEGFDGTQDKKTLLESFANSAKLVVSASGVAGRSLDTLTSPRMGNCYILGDFATAADQDETIAPKVIMVAAMMSTIVLNYLEIVSKPLPVDATAQSNGRNIRSA